MGAAPKLQQYSEQPVEKQDSRKVHLRLVTPDFSAPPSEEDRKRGNELGANIFIFFYLSFLVGIVVIFELYY